MGLVTIEKKGTVNIDGMSTDEQVAHLGTLGEDNLGSLNLEPTNYEFKQKDPLADQGMNRGHIKKEINIFKICIVTILLLTLIIGLAGIGGFIAYKFGKINIHLFPRLESYDLKQYNTSIKRCFLIISGMVVGTCFLMLFVFNMVVKSRFINNYLSKMGVFIYSIFAVIVNSSLFVGIIYVYFYIVDRIARLIDGYLAKGIITENVNIKTIELFKYAILVVCIIFLVLNSFSIVGIIKDKNRFVFEEEM